MMQRYYLYWVDYLGDRCEPSKVVTEGIGYVTHEDAAALEAENAALREKLNLAEIERDQARISFEICSNTLSGYAKITKSPKETEYKIMREAYVEHSGNSQIDYDGREWSDFVGGYEAGASASLAAAEARTVLTDDVRSFLRYLAGLSAGQNIGKNITERATELLAASAAPAAQEDAKTPRGPTNEQFVEWCERHDMFEHLHRAAFDDAASLYLIAANTPKGT